MYAKVQPTDTPQFVLYPTEGAVQVGRHWSLDPPAERKYSTELEVDIDELNINGIDDEPSSTLDPTQWGYKYAWWYQDGRLTGVVTSGSLYVLGESGSTIDRA